MTEWDKCIDHQLEMLQAKWDADDGATEGNAQSQMRQSDLDSTQ